MLELVRAVKFVKPMQQGRTRPALIGVIDAQGTAVEVVAKFSGGCDRAESGLAAEAVTAMLALDLGLPVPRPYLTCLSTEFVDAIPDDDTKALARKSCSVCYGSRRLPAGARAWIAGSPVHASMLGLCANIFAFDAFIDNVDRRVENTNLLASGDQIWIYDHELAFANQLVIGWKPPWAVGSREHLRRPGAHVLYGELQGKLLDFSGFRAAWGNISNERLDAYATAIPEQWSKATAVVTGALQLIRETRDKLEPCLAEVVRILQ